MLNLTFEQRISAWRDFRQQLETHDDPAQAAIDFWRVIPEVNIQADPWEQSTWPDPWEMIHENFYCPFVKILAICYTLQLTDRFSQDHFEINITQDKENSETKYLLTFNGLCIGYDSSKPISISDLPKSITVEKSYTMPSLQ